MSLNSPWLKTFPVQLHLNPVAKKTCYYGKNFNVTIDHLLPELWLSNGGNDAYGCLSILLQMHKL